PGIALGAGRAPRRRRARARGARHRQPPHRALRRGGPGRRRKAVRGLRRRPVDEDRRRLHLTRATYSPVRVSTRITSPCSTNSGTRTTAPVASLAGLTPPLAVSPRTPGSVSTISSSTKFGGDTSSGTLFHSVTWHISWPSSHWRAS